MLTRINMKKEHYENILNATDSEIAQEFLKWDKDPMMVSQKWNYIFQEIFDIKIGRIQFIDESVISMAFAIKREFKFIENDEVILERDVAYGKVD